MNANTTDVTVLIDKSESMGEQSDDAILGFNAFLEIQRQAAQRTKSRCTLQLIQFGEKYEPGPRLDVNKHPMLTREQYAPRGHTALLDALGRTIEDAGKRFADMAEADRPEKVVIVVLTDGNDDASRLFSAAAIREKISTQHDIYKWDFVYLGANQDAWVVGSQYGFQPGKTLSTAATSAGTQHGFEAAANYVAGTLAAPDAESALEQRFTPEDIRRARQASNHREMRV